VKIESGQSFLNITSHTKLEPHNYRVFKVVFYYKLQGAEVVKWEERVIQLGTISIFYVIASQRNMRVISRESQLAKLQWFYCPHPLNIFGSWL